MDSASASTQPQGIGPIVAIVGTSGWQCRLCNSTFPRSISIDHHMITSHHPQTSQVSHLPSAISATSSGQLGDRRPNMEEESEMQYESGDSGKAGTERNPKQSCESIVGVRCAPPCSETSPNPVSAHTSDIESRKEEGSLRIKVEPGIDSLAISEHENSRESLPLYFDEASVQSVTLPAGKQHMSLLKQDNVEKKNTRVEMTPSEKADMNLAGCYRSQPFSQDLYSADDCSQIQRQMPTPSSKPYKRCTCSCGQVFESKYEFKSHRRAVHCTLKNKSFICHICGSEYKYKRGLNRHLSEKGAQAFSCSSCTKQFHDQTSLKEHQNLCHSSERLPCRSSEKERMDGDTNQTQNSALSESDKTSHAEAEDSFPWECSKCKKHFGNKSVFREHLRECGILVCVEGKRHFTCNLCSRGFQCLVPYHRHYVQDHKLAFLGQSVDSPAHLSPFTGDSPVPSPAPSVTSEINTAMAEVSLNQSQIPNVADISSPQSTTVDLTSYPGIHEKVQSRIEEDDRSLLISDPQMTTAVCSSSVTSAVCTSSSSFVPVMTSSNMNSLTSTSDSSSLSLTTATSSSEPMSLTSTASSSDPTSLTSDFGSFCPLSSATSQASEAESIVISDSEDSHSIDSSVDSDEEWEVILEDSEQEDGSKKTGPNTEDYKAAHEAKGFAFKGFPGPWDPRHPYHHCPPPPPCPPPPFAHPQSFPPPSYFDEGFAPPFAHFFAPRHHHHHHHHPRFDRGRFMHCLFGATRFGHPRWFHQGNGTSSYTNNSGSAATSETDPNQESKSSKHDDSAAYGQEHSNPLFHAEAFSQWAGKWKEDKRCKKMQKRKFFSMLKHCQQGGQFLFCPECPQQFMEGPELDRHCQEKHSLPGNYVCFICQQTFSRPLPYNKHMKEHFETWLRTSSHRGRGRGHGLFGMGRRFFKHLWKADGPYNLGSQPFGHSHQPQGTDNDSGEPDLSATEDFKECPVCNKKYRANSRESFFERHVNSHFGVEVFSFKCEECDKKFLEKGKYTAHLATHKASPYVCNTCGNSYQNKTSLKRHERIHTGERPHKCRDCGEGFIELRELERHRMKHTGQDPFQCKVCGKGFTLKDSVLNHIRKQHAVKNAHQCIIRAVPLPEGDQHRKHHKASLSSEVPAGSVSVKTEERSESQEPFYMELE